MKKWLGVFLVLILTAAMALGAQAEGTLTRFEEVYRQALALCDNAAYALVQENNGSTLYAWGYDQGQPEALCTLPAVPLAVYASPYRELSKSDRAAADEAVQTLVADGDTLYAVNKFAGRIGKVDAKGVTWQKARFDTALLFDKAGWERMTTSLFIDGGTLYMLINFWEEDMDRYYNQKLLCVNINTGRATLWPAPDVREMCAYGDEVLLLCTGSDQNNYLCALSVTSGELRTLPVGVPSGASIGGIGYDRAQGLLYIAGQNALYRSNGAEDFKICQSTPDSYAQALSCLPDGRVALAGMAVHVVTPPAPGAEKSTLTVVANIPGDAARQAFLQENPDALLDERMESLTASQVADRIRAGDADVDIFAVKTDGAFGALLNQGFAAPLEQNGVVMASVGDMYPQIRAALADAQGVIRAYPASLSAQIQRVNLPLWRKHFGDAPLPATWAELFDAMLLFEQLPDTDGDLFFMNWYYPDMARRVTDAYIRQYADGAVDFSAAAFMDALAALERVQALMQSRGIDRLYEEEMYPESEVIGPRSIIHTDMVSSNMYGVTLDSTALTLTFAPGDTPIIPAYMDAYILNPNSKNQALALAYIACATRADTGLIRAYLTHQSMTEPVPGWSAGEWRVSAEAIAAWQGMAQNLRFHIDSPLVSDAMSEQANRLCARYVGGQMTKEELAKQLNDVADMVAMEIGGR